MSSHEVKAALAAGSLCAADHDMHPDAVGTGRYPGSLWGIN